MSKKEYHGPIPNPQKPELKSDIKVGDKYLINNNIYTVKEINGQKLIAEWNNAYHQLGKVQDVEFSLGRFLALVECKIDG